MEYQASQKRIWPEGPKYNPPQKQSLKFRNWSEMSAQERDDSVNASLNSNPRFRAMVLTAEQNRELGKLGLKRKMSGLSNLTSERRNGAQVKYPGCEHVVPSIWTPIRVFPYPVWRRRLGLQKSYLPGECEVLDRGWLPGEKNKQGGVQ